MNIRILPVKKEMLPVVKDFILPYEYLCTNLAFYVRKEDDYLFVITKKESVNSTEDILGVLHCDGSLLHCIPSKTELDNSFFQQAFINFQKLNKIKCIIGEREITEFLTQILAITTVKPFQVFNYDLMILDTAPMTPPAPLSCDDHIKRCTEDDLEALLEIQRQYLIKEVAPTGRIVSELETAVALKQILKNQLCLALISDDEIVAKANSNAIGFNFVQIGGVYTHPLYRRNGYGWHLIHNLCIRIQKTYRYVSLFVKEKNTGAIKLYEKCGFAKAGNYQIAYFNN